MKHILIPCLALPIAPIGALAAPFDLSDYRALLGSGDFTLDSLDYDWTANDLIGVDNR